MDFENSLRNDDRIRRNRKLLAWPEPEQQGLRNVKAGTMTNLS